MVKLGIVGCGGMGRAHLSRLAAIRGARVVAASDKDAGRLNACGREFGIAHLLNDYKALCRMDGLDAVLVCTPPFNHRPITAEAARHGKHVFCEKPIATEIADGKAMIELCRKHKVQLMIGLVRHFDNCWMTLRKLILDGAIGRPVTWQLIRNSSGPYHTAWFFDKKLSAGPCVESAVHNFDFARFIFGPAESVVASARAMKTSTAMDTFHAVIRFRSGDEHVVSWSWGLAADSSGGAMDCVIGPKGAIRFPGAYPPPTQRAPANAFLVDTGKRKRLARFRRNDLVRDEQRQFIKVVRGEEPPEVTGEDGLACLKIAHAVLKAAETGRRVGIR